MTIKRAVFAAAVLLASFAPAHADGWDWEWNPDLQWRITHRVLADVENRIALIEANPEIDDGYKAPIIGNARKDVRRLRAALPPPRWQWASPCCYGRRPIHIR